MGVPMIGKHSLTKRTSVPLACLLLVLSTALLGLPALSVTGPRVYAWPDTQEIAVGETGWIELRVDGADDLRGVSLYVLFDPSIIEVLDASGDPGIQVDPGNVFDGLDWTEERNRVNEPPGTMEYVFGLTDQDTEGPSGDGFVLARIRFRALRQGVCPIDIDVARLWQSGPDLPDCGSYVDAIREGGMILVVPPPTATATPTLTPQGTPPTQTPTTVPITAEVKIDPPISDAWIGSIGFVDIVIESASQLYGAWVDMSFDSCLEVLDYMDPPPGDQLEPGSIFEGKNWYEIRNLADNAAGSIQYAASLSHESEPSILTSGLLARIHFRTLSPGPCEFRFDHVLLVDKMGYALDPVLYFGGQVEVENVTATPTATNTPTVTNTPTATETPSVTPTPSGFKCFVPLVFKDKS